MNINRNTVTATTVTDLGESVTERLKVIDLRAPDRRGDDESYVVAVIDLQGNVAWESDHKRWIKRSTFVDENLLGQYRVIDSGFYVGSTDDWLESIKRRALDAAKEGVRT
jgi:hypothetical protein